MSEKAVYENPDDVERNLAGKKIYIDRRVVLLPESQPIGLKVWGMIDYMIHHAKMADNWLRVPDRPRH